MSQFLRFRPLLNQLLALLLVFTLLLSASAGQQRPAANNSPGSFLNATQQRTPGQLHELYGKLPLMFEANHGQTDPQIRFLSRGNGYSIFLTSSEAVFVLRKSPGEENRQRDAGPQQYDPDSFTGLSRRERHGWQASTSDDTAVLRMSLVGANDVPPVNGSEELPGRANYLIGNDPQKWHTNIPTYASVRYGNVYQGIDLVFYGNQQQLEYDFVVAPGADFKTIRLAFEGADQLQIDSAGDLVLQTAGGEIRQQKPVVYQEINGKKQEIESSYTLSGKNEVGFQVGAYDRARPLVIDPVLVYSTYLGGGGNDRGQSIAVDSAGSAYVTGTTTSANFPLTNPAQPNLASSLDAFVTKLNPAGTAIVYSTYLGGNRDDFSSNIGVDSAGNAHTIGFTESTNFPAVNARQSSNAGGIDAFIAKLNSTGNAFLYSTYIGGNGDDLGNGIAVDAAGNAYGIGDTDSTNLQTVNALRSSNAGGVDTFVTKLNPSGSTVLYATYAGGSGDDYGVSIAVDADGNTYGIGYTSSNDLPIVNALQPINGGGFDAFVVKLNPAGSTLLYSTYLGGSDADEGYDIAVDAANNAYVTGHTFASNFPTANSFQAARAGQPFFRSTDGGNNWSASDIGLTGAVIRALVFDPRNSATIYVGTSSGFFRSTDGGRTWIASNNGLLSTSMRALAIDPFTPTTIYAGTSGGLFKSTDGGVNWSVSSTGMSNIPVRALVIDPGNPSILYAGTDNDGVYKSTNNGASWNPRNSGLSNQTVNALAIDPRTPTTLYVGTAGGVFRSTDGANTWSPVNNGLTSLTVNTLEINPANPTTLYAGTTNGFFRSTNGGISWVAGNTGLTNTNIADITIHAANPNIVYVGTSSGVFRSIDGGSSWSLTSVGLTTPFVRTLAVDPANPSIVYAGTNTSDDAFVAKISPLGSALSFSTYMGGIGADLGYGIAVTPLGNVYISGVAGSNNFPAVNPLEATRAGGFDLFAAKLNPAGVVLYSTFLGGSGDEYGYDIAVDPSGSAYITGRTDSTNFRTASPLQSSNRGGGEAFVVKISDALVQFSGATYSVGENAGNAIITVTRIGDTSDVTTVDFSTVDNPALVRCDVVTGTAYARCDYSTTVDTLRFAPGETQKTFTIPIIDDAHVEGNETLQIILGNSIGAGMGNQSTATLTITDNDSAGAANPIFNTPFFVRQQYLDFLSREPEPEGFNAWVGVLDRCPNVNNDPSCDRIEVSASFFRSQEFQIKGYFVYRFYKVSFNRLPRYVEIIPDMRSVTGQTGEEVTAKREAFTNAWVQRPEFRAAYDTVTDPAAYVDTLLQTAGVTLANRNQLVDNLRAGRLSRAQVLRAIVESPEVDRKEYNGAFVAMQYFGYLRRDPETEGYSAWLRVIDRGDSYRVMVDGFMNSTEYRLRFGPVP